MANSKRIFVTNRLPFTINTETKELRRGSGGLVSALLDVDLGQPFKWMGFETDSQVIKNLNSVSHDKWKNIDIHPVFIEKKQYDTYYNKFANDNLWPLFHYETQHSTYSKDGWEAYQHANQVMAEEVLKICGPEDTIWIHDFHFMLLPQILKSKKPNLKVGFFLHIPFPSSEIFKQLPVREKILNGLIACDLIGFQEHSYLRHFVVSLGAFLGIESSFFKAIIGNHTLNLGVYPISINTELFKKKSHHPEIDKAAEKYKKKISSDFLILGIDRLDYMKGIELKLQGFKRALQKYPSLRGRLNLLQIAIPTRTGVPAYVNLKNQIEQLVGNINGEFGSPGYTPVHYIYNSVRERDLLGLYRRADCLLITSKRDGMNLVAMEYTMSQNLNEPGTLILSEFIGASSLLGSAQIVNPWDEDAIADEIYNCFNMPPLVKSKKISEMQATLSQYSATNWANSFLDDLDSTSKKSIYSPPKTITENIDSWPNDFYQKMNSKNSKVLFIDYDGTLVPIQKKPKDAQIDSDTLLLLNKLNEYIPICIISGRPKEFIDEQFKESNFTFIAEHGAYFRFKNESWRNRVTSDIKSWYQEVEKVMQSYTYRVPQSFIEKKEASLVWHYRESPTDFSNYQAKKLFDELQVVLANQPVVISSGSKIVEAKAVECNKGNFLRWYMEQMEPTTPAQIYLCIGDDLTDEDMFHALQLKQGYSIKVGSQKSVANLHLIDQKTVNLFLSQILELSISLHQ